MEANEVSVNNGSHYMGRNGDQANNYYLGSTEDQSDNHYYQNGSKYKGKNGDQTNNYYLSTIRFKKIIKQVIKLATSVTTWVMPGIGFVIVFAGETLVKIVATCIIYNMVKKWQTVTDYSRHKQFEAWIMHIMTFFLGFQCKTVTPPIIYPHNNLSFTELYLMVPLLRWNIKMTTVQHYTFVRERC